ncbi:hypothetical protein Bca101_083827 [Brassica carinata]
MNGKASVSKELNAKHSKVPLFVFLPIFSAFTIDRLRLYCVAFMQSTGNAKANQYWESELPPHFERSSSDAFIRAKYNEKKWVSPGGIQPAPVVNQLSCKVSHLVERGPKPETPTKTRTRSLDDEFLLKNILEVTPPETRIRAGSVDMKMKENVYVLPLPVGIDVKKPNQKNDIFAGDLYQNRRTTIAPPSSWATFDCAGDVEVVDYVTALATLAPDSTNTSWVSPS